ncbi:hypothetical protein BDAP_001097 [Binucleata daphniae]
MIKTPDQVTEEGLHLILDICNHIKLPKKVILTSQIIFHSVNNKVKNEAQKLIPHICVFLSAKIEESYLNLDTFLNFIAKKCKINEMHNVNQNGTNKNENIEKNETHNQNTAESSMQKQNLLDLNDIVIVKEYFLKIEKKIVIALECNFEAKHVHFYVAKICNTLKINIEDKFNYCDKLYMKSAVQNISILQKKEFEPFHVALALFKDSQIIKIEKIYNKKIDFVHLRKIKSSLFDCNK